MSAIHTRGQKLRLAGILLMITILARNMPSFPDGMGTETEEPPAGPPISTSPPNIISVPPPCSDPQPPHTLAKVR